MNISIKKYHPKDSAQFEAVLRHCDRDVREEMKTHSNIHIDRTKTKENLQLYGGVEETKERFHNRLMVIDALGNTNRRSDRVECVERIVNIPKNLADRYKEYFDAVNNFFAQKYGAENIINSYLHQDEVHEYSYYGDVNESLQHIHIFFVPERDGKLISKELNDRKGLKELNQEVEQMTWGKFDARLKNEIPLNTKTVEEFKYGEGKEAIEILKAAKEPLDIKTEPVQDDDERVMIHKSDLETIRQREGLRKYFQKQYKAASEKLLAKYPNTTQKDINLAEEYMKQASEQLQQAEKERREAQKAKEEAQKAAERVEYRIQSYQNAVRKAIKELEDLSIQEETSDIMRDMIYNKIEELESLLDLIEKPEPAGDGEYERT